MTGSRILICGVGLIVVGAAPARAEDRAGLSPAPPSLRMRPNQRLGQAAAVAADDAAPPGAAARAPVARGDLAAAAVEPRPPILVTGSRIARATATTPSAVTVVTRDELLAAGRTMVGDILQALPEQGNAINAQFNNGGDGATRIDLRGLDVDRTLVLVNGRRFVAVGTGADSTVDLNTIPLAVIDRVEVQKDGASAVYGSGAVGGVVNIITRSRFEGTEASLYTGRARRGDGFSLDASVITGHRTEAPGGHVVFSAGVQRQEPVFAGDRAFSRFDKVFDFRTRRESTSGSTATPGGRIDQRSIDVDGDGNPDGFNLCGAGVAACTPDGRGGFRPFVAPADLYNFAAVNFLYTPSSRFNAFSAGSYPIRPHVSGFFESSYLHRDSDQELAPTPFLADVPISRDSIFNPFGGDVFDYRRRLEEFGPRGSQQSVDTLRTVVGLRGELPGGVAGLRGWSWELSYNFGRSAATQKATGNLVRSRLRDAVGPSFFDGRGALICGTPSAPIAGCVPMNILGPSGSISAAAVGYAGFTGVSTGVNEQHSLLATAQGQVARLGDRGDISAAISADVRRDSGEVTPDLLTASGDTTGARLAAITGSNRVLEAAAEVSIVPARDPDGVERLELDFAARAVRYDRFAGVMADARALVRPLRGVTLRASYAAAFSAPTIVDRFAAAAESFPAAIDPCDRAFDAAAPRAGRRSPTTEAECARQGVPADAVFGTGQQRMISRGNLELGPEQANVVTAGVVVEPPSIPGLALSVDYWDVDVRQAIQQASIATIFTNCYERGIRAFCDLVRRDPLRGGAIDFVDNPTTNLGGTATAGLDVAVTYDRDVPRAGKLHLRAMAQRLEKFDRDTGSTVLRGLGNYDLGVFPTQKASLTAAWQHPAGAGAGVNVQFVGGFLECEANDCNAGELARDVDPYTKLDVFGSYAFGGTHGRTLLSVGVNNVLDQAPPTIYGAFTADSDPSTYDYLGRFAYVRLTQRL
jgi:iron complex outermembrane recepter protein